MSRPKVLVIHHSGLIGGGGQSLLDLCLVLRARYELEVHVPERPPDLSRLLARHGVRTQVYGFRMAKVPWYSGGMSAWHPRFWFYVALIPAQWRYWRRVIDASAAHVVIVNSGVLAWLGPLCRGRVSVCYVRETQPGNAKSRGNRILRGLRGTWSTVAYLSQWDLESDAGVGVARLLVRDGTDPRRFEDRRGRTLAASDLGVPENGVNILFPNPPSSLKGFDTIVEALALLADLDVSLVVAGPDPNEATFRWWQRLLGRGRFESRVADRVRSLGLGDRVRFLGVLDEMTVAYAASDVVVFPMREPHQSRPAYEAGFQSKPIVVSGFDNVGECIEDGVNGLVFEPNDPSSLASVLRRLVTSPELRRELGRGNMSHAHAAHGPEVAFGELLKFLDDSLADGAGRV